MAPPPTMASPPTIAAQAEPAPGASPGMSRLTIALLAGAAAMALAAGGLLWASQGEAVFVAWLTAAVAGCF